MRLLFSADTNVLSSDLQVDPSATTTQATTISGVPTTSPATTIGATTNPVRPCTGGNCPVCTNNFASKLIRATGDWTIDAGSTALWLANEPFGLMTFDQRSCLYELVITNIKPNFKYLWKVTVDNSFKENYGFLFIILSRYFGGFA